MTTGLFVFYIGILICYVRINQLLQSAPNVGIDDILAAMFRKMSPEEFDEVIARARQQSKWMLADPAMRNDEVRDVVADCYRALHLMNRDFVRGVDAGRACRQYFNTR